MVESEPEVADFWDNYAKATRVAAHTAAQRQRATEAARSLAPLADGGAFATLGDATQRPDPATLYARLLAVSLERAELYGRVLAAQWAAAGRDAVVHDLWAVDGETGELKPAGQQVTALARLEADERRNAERLLVQGAKLSLEERAHAALERDGAVLAGALRRFAEKHGLDWTDPDIRRDAQRAMLEARDAAERAEVTPARR